jgi:hypothetical protein
VWLPLFDQCLYDRSCQIRPAYIVLEPDRLLFFWSNNLFGVTLMFDFLVAPLLSCIEGWLWSLPMVAFICYMTPTSPLPSVESPPLPSLADVLAEPSAAATGGPNQASGSGAEGASSSAAPAANPSVQTDIVWFALKLYGPAISNAKRTKD